MTKEKYYLTRKDGKANLANIKIKLIIAKNTEEIKEEKEAVHSDCIHYSQKGQHIMPHSQIGK